MSAQPNLRPVEASADDGAYRTPPHNLEAEQALLGAILVNNDACDRVSSFLLPDHFSEAVLRLPKNVTRTLRDLTWQEKVGEVKNG